MRTRFLRYRTRRSRIHILLCQHMGLMAAYRYPAWLLEGIAMASVSQMDTSWYPDKAETYAMIRDGDCFPPYLYMTLREDGVMIKTKNRIAFMYSEFGCIVDFFIEKFRKE